MEKHMLFIGRLALLPVVLLTIALRGEAASPAFSAAPEIRQDVPKEPIGSGTYRPAGWSWIGHIESSPYGMTQLLAQKQQPVAPAPDQAKPSGEETLDLNDQVIRDVFGPLQRGMEGHNLYQVLAVFDEQQMHDYAQLRDRLRSFFGQYDAMRFRYQLLQVTSEKNRGSAVADIEMEATPADESQPILRRDIQMRFQMNLGSKGWKLVGFAPADFFAQ
jgi:hypothetical protein